MRHYKTLNLEAMDAKSIVSTSKELDDDGVPWKENLVAEMTDGCNTMTGCQIEV